MRVAIYGAKGMAGHLLSEYLKANRIAVLNIAKTGETTGFNLDINNKKELNKSIQFIKEHSFDYIINCAGILAPDSNKNPEDTILVNSWFPKYLETVFKDDNTRIIHISTDCVFDGKNTIGYIETDSPTETNIYGRSKALGEINNSKDITFRLSIIGPEIKPNGSGLLHWFLTSEEQELNGWSNAWWNGMTTLELSRCILNYITKRTNLSGIYHLTDNNIKTNKYELLTLFNEIFNRNKTILKINAPKSVNKVLINTRTNEFNFNIKSYYRQLLELKTYMDNSKLYEMYLHKPS